PTAVGIAAAALRFRGLSTGLPQARPPIRISARTVTMLFVSLAGILLYAASSANYINHPATIAGGGGKVTSANYSTHGSVSQTGIGSASSANYINSSDYAYTVWPQGAPETVLTTASGPNNPAASFEDAGAQDVEMLQVRLTANTVENINVTQLVITHSGTGDPATMVTSADLYVDGGNLGVYDDGIDTFIDQGAYAAGAYTFTGFSQPVNAGATQYWLVVYDFHALAIGYFTAGLNTAGGVTATGAVSGDPAVVAGAFPIAGGAKGVDVTEDYPISLLTGWNLIALPVDPVTPYLAEDLAQLIITQGGACTQIMRWNPGWLVHPVPSGTNNFAIELGKGYFVRCTAPSTLTITGYPVSNVTIGLNAGWTLVGVPFGSYLAEDLAQEINTDTGAGNCTQVMRWNPGWLVHPVPSGTNNFAIERHRGYFVKTTAGGTVVVP
ncbi:MAG: hypothetical protein RDV41_13800, partial [Planctomycetota bacterium]|nr:hypothetical protein [Planctomycetota bacterium]